MIQCAFFFGGGDVFGIFEKIWVRLRLNIPVKAHSKQECSFTSVLSLVAIVNRIFAECLSILNHNNRSDSRFFWKFRIG